MKNSAYFAADQGYDKAVYENDLANWFKIVGMLLLFYIFQGLHWWANFELGIHDTKSSTLYNLCIFGSAILVIAIMLILGANVNKKKLTHEFYIEKISEEKQRLAEEAAKAAQKAANEAKIQKAWTRGKQISQNSNIETKIHMKHLVVNWHFIIL